MGRDFHYGADLFAKGNMSALENQQGNFTAGGFLDIKNLFYSSAAFPQPLENGNMKVQVENSGGIADNTSINITTGHMEVGKDPVDFNLQLRHPMSSVDFTGAAKGRFSLIIKPDRLSNRHLPRPILFT